jgi:hypothetical protein
VRLALGARLTRRRSAGWILDARPRCGDAIRPNSVLGEDLSGDVEEAAEGFDVDVVRWAEEIEIVRRSVGEP